MAKIKITSIIKWCGKMVLAMLCSLILVSLFAICYKHTSPHVMAEDGATDFKWKPQSLSSTMMEGFSWIRMDENGYNNEFFTEDIDVLVMGSSHVEALQVPTKENFASLLNDNINMNVYNIGVSSHNFYRCVDNLAAALDHYSPSKYVIIETYIPILEENFMRPIILRSAIPEDGPDIGLKYYIQMIPACKPLLNQLIQWRSLSINNVRTENYSDIDIENDGYFATLRAFLEIIRDESEKHGVTPIIIYQTRETLLDDGTLVFPDNNSEYIAKFSSICRDLNIVFADLTPEFNNAYQENHLFSHGFPNTSIGSGHLNLTGHRIIAETLTRLINEMEEEKCP